MKGMMGWSGTCNLPFAIVIFCAPDGDLQRDRLGV